MSGQPPLFRAVALRAPEARTYVWDPDFQAWIPSRADRQVRVFYGEDALAEFLESHQPPEWAVRTTEIISNPQYF